MGTRRSEICGEIGKTTKMVSLHLVSLHLDVNDLRAWYDCDPTSSGGAQLRVHKVGRRTLISREAAGFLEDQGRAAEA